MSVHSSYDVSPYRCMVGAVGLGEPITPPYYSIFVWIIGDSKESRPRAIGKGKDR